MKPILTEVSKTRFDTVPHQRIVSKGGCTVKWHSTDWTVGFMDKRGNCSVTMCKSSKEARGLFNVLLAGC